MTISTKEEILSRPLADVTHLDSSSINMAASMVTEFDIKLSVKRKSPTDALALNCHFVAVTCIGRKPTHYLITFGVPSNNCCVTEHTTNSEALNPVQTTMSSAQQSQQTPVPKPNTEPRGSLQNSIRRGTILMVC